MNEIELYNGIKVPRALSFSRIDKFLKCKLQYYYDYVEDRETTSAEALNVGKAIHLCLEDYAKHCLSNGIEADEEFMQNLAYEIDYLNPKAWKDMNKVVMDFASEYEFSDDRFDEFYVEKKVALDKNLEPCDWRSDNAVFRAVFDLAGVTPDNDLVITDWKSNRHLPPDSEVEGDLQLMTYAWAADKFFDDIENFKVRLHFLRYHTVRPRDGGVFDKAEVDRFQDRLFEIFKQMYQAEKNDEFPATINSQCRFCSFRKICDDFQELNDDLDGVVEVPETEDERVELAREYQAISQRRKELRDTLKDVVEAHGPIKIDDNGEVLDFHTGTSTNFHEAKSVLETLRDETDIPQDELWDMLKISNSNAKSLLKDYGEYDMMEKVAEQESKPRFTFK